MWKMFLPILVVGLSACTAQGDSPKRTVDRDADIKTLTDVKKVKWRELYYQQDVDGLADFLADEFVLIANDSFGSKKKEVDWLRNNSWNGPSDFLYTIEDIVFITDDAAIVYGRGTSTRTDEGGKPCAHSYISSNTLRRVDDTWHPVSSHVSDAKCEVN